MGTGLKFLFEEEVTMKQGTILGSQIGRWIILAAVVALLGALLLTIRPVGAQQEAPPSIPNAETVFSYAEKGTGPVTTYRARDPEGNKIFWTLSGADAGVFTIDGGALRFKSPPNYESPSDGDERADTTATGTDPVGVGDNIYRVTVRFGAGGQDGTPGPDDYVGDDLGELDLTVTVTNIDEPGRVYISSLQPQIGTELTATVTDQDGVAVTGSWQWASSDSMTGNFENIPERSGDRTYRPVDADLGKYLQVTARYRDNVSGADTRERAAVSAYPVRKDIVSSNNPPRFPDQRTLGLLADTPAGDPPAGDDVYTRETTERFIHEGAPAGTRVGAPVTAFDDATDIEVLTYSLSGARGHVDSFNIDPVTGQITVSAAARLNADVASPTGLGGAQGPYDVTVIATDGDGDTQTIEVAIRVVRVDEPPKITVGPREMSHWESDRTVRTATRIDTDLDSGVLIYSNDPPAPVTTNTATEGYQDAIYTATDQEDDNTDPPTVLTWSLAGPDATRKNADGDSVPVFVFSDRNAANVNDPEAGIVRSRSATGAMATLAFYQGPDFEKPWDTNKDNVYEVTLVVTDSVGATAEYDVTVKVINSTDDNKPGSVTILNRVPEVATALKATFEDPDKPTKELKWQWYRSVSTHDYPGLEGKCPGYMPVPVGEPLDDGESRHRYFIDTAPGLPVDDVAWQAIPRATKATYTPGYDEDSGGMSVVTEGDNARTVVWTGGDIDVTIVTTFATETIPESTYYAWQQGTSNCLRAAVTYRDAVDRTHAGQDDPDTGVDETLEGTFIGSEYPVKRIDEENDKPVFTEGGIDTDGITAIGPAVSTYTAERREDASGAVSTDSLDITEAFAATDVMTDEDDDSGNQINISSSEDPDVRNSPGPGPGADVLTYSLSGTDAKYFAIVGSVEHPTSYDPDGPTVGVIGTAPAIVDPGSLVFRVPLDAEGLPHTLDFESKTRYTVTITATDPSGDKDTVNVTVNITNYNEAPDWMKGTSPAMVVYAENGMADVGTYLADDPEGAGISYALVTAADPDVRPVIAVEDVRVDHAKFSIDPLSGSLRFKSSPNYEKPGDVDTNNKYLVTVRATVVDNPPLTTSPPTDPPGPHAITRKVTVVVTNLNEAPVFSDTTDTLMISENPDDPEKEPPSAAGYLYLLNRGVGKPAANLPAAPNLDVGIPVAAFDDDSTGNFAVGGYVSPGKRDRIDGLTYTLSGTDAAHFHVVPATGQILTMEKLDYEAKNEYKVTVKATDPMGESDSINMTIEVTDVDEVPVPRVLVISGRASHTYEENGTDALGEYTVVAGGGATVGAWSLDGTDASSFMLTGTGDSRMLTFRSAPDYDNPMGGANDDSNTYEITIKVTDSSERDVYGTFAVSVTVTDVDELGALDGPASASVNEGDTDLDSTYTLTGGDGTSTVTWSLEGDDAGQFTLDSSQALMFSSAPDYEDPMGGAADDSTTYKVTVMAKAGGEMEMVEVTVTVDNVEEPGTVTLTPARPSVGTEITATLEDGDIVSTVTWSWASGDNADGTGFSGIGTNSATYTPVAADAGKYIGAWATYDDGYASGNAINKVTDTAVTQVAVNAAPAFSSATATRTIAEDAAANTNIGDPVAATDPNGDTLTYGLEGTDAASFDIDSGTGQLSTSAALNYESKTAYNVVVRASDPAGLSGTIDVTINVTDVVEVVPPLVATYQYEGDPRPGIQILDLYAAIDDYFDEVINPVELFELINAYFE